MYKSRINWLTWFLALLVVAGLAIWAKRENEQLMINARRELDQLTRAMIGALRGSALCEVRDGKMRTDRIQTIYENIITTTDLKFIRLCQDGQLLLAAGELEQWKSLEQQKSTALFYNQSGEFEFDALFPGIYVRSELLHMDGCKGPCHGGDGQCGAYGNGRQLRKSEQATKPKKQQLLIGIEVEDFLAARFALRQRLLIIFVCGSLAAVAGALLINRFMHQRFLQKQLQQMQARAESLEELNLAARGLAHETKNPLGLIHGLAQRADKQANDPILKEMLVAIQDEADVAVSRLNSFMAYAGGREPQLKTVALKTLCERLKLIFEPEFSAKSVQLILPEDFPDVLADEEMLSQMIVNLLFNSLRACQSGDQVSLSVVSTGHELVLKIADTGSGIASDLLPDIFKPYISGSGSHGLGLAIVRRLAELHDWHIAVDSAVGQGTTMTLTGLKLA